MASGNKLHLEIVTPQRKALEEDIDFLSVPTKNGLIGILPGHEALFTALVEGEIKVKTGEKEMYLAIGGGFMEVNANRVSVLVSRAFHADELNEAEIRKAETAAREALARRGEEKEVAEALSTLRRSTLELKVLQRRRKKQ